MSTAIPLPAPPSGSWMLTPEHSAARDTLKRGLADKRLAPPKDAAELYTYGGPAAHLMMLTTLERMYLLAPSIDDVDRADFLGFIEASMYIIVAHHRLEEDYIFPEMDRITNTKLWGVVRDEHSQFVPHFAAIWHYARHCRSVEQDPHPADLPEPYTPLDDLPVPARRHLDFEKGWNGTALQRHMDSFMVDFVKHICAEDNASSVENVRKADLADVLAVDKGLKRKAYETGNLHIYIPIFWTNMEKQDVATFAIANGIMRRLLLPWWFGSRHAAWWRFSAYPEQLTWAGSAL